MTPPCPSLEDLHRLGRDSLDGEAFEAIEAHVAACPACQDLLEQLARFDAMETTAEGEAVPRDPDPGPIPELPGFTMRSVLGRGGSGVVYEAVQNRIGRRVAIKVLSAGPVLDARARQRWMREARAIGRIRHPHVVRLHEAGEHDGRLFLVLDLIPGGSLSSAVPGPMPPRSAARLIETVARTVESLHRSGVLHLDIKPSNILLDGPPGCDWSEAVPMLSDFGIALNEQESGGEASASGVLGTRGTPAFMAPEQVAGRRSGIGPAADVFALGATLYTLLTGRPPFQAATAIETLDLLRSRDPAPPRSMVPGLPPDLETICLACLQKDPARRYGSAEALAADLRRFLDGYPIQARPVSKLEEAARWCRRHPIPAILAGALATTILVSLIGLTALWRRSEFQRDQAEAARERAAQEEQAAQEAVVTLVGLLRETVTSPDRLVSDQVRHALPVVLDLTAKLRRTPDLASNQAVAIAALELRLTEYLGRRGESDGVRDLLDDAMALLTLRPERLQTDARAASQYADVLMYRAGPLTSASRYDEAEGFLRRAGRALEPHAGDPRAINAIIRLHLTWVELARLQTVRNNPDEAERILRASQDAFARMMRKAPGNPMLELFDRASRYDMAPTGSVANAVAEAMDRLPAGTVIPEALAMLLGDVIARELCELVEKIEPGEPLDTEATVARLLRELDGRLAAFRRDPVLTQAALEQLGQRGGLREIAQRRAGRLDEARRTTAWMAGLGHALEQRDPTSAGPHLLLSRAFEHQSKIAWTIPDRPEIERTLRAALREASIALELEPGDEHLRQHVAGLSEKYLRLVTEEPDGKR